MKKQNSKINKGITLISLIITIIIMLIIVTVTISVLTGNNILFKAESVVKKYNSEELQEKIKLAFAEYKIAQYTKSNYSIEDNFKGIFEEIYGKNNVIISKSGKNHKINIKNAKTTFRIKSDGSIEEYEEMDPTNVYAKLDDNGILYLRATEKEGYKIYTNYTSIQKDWNTAGDATTASVLKVVIEEKIAPTTTSSMFASLNNLEVIDNIQNLHTENSTNMSYMFHNCKKLASIDVSSFDTSKVTKMNCMFYNCSSIIELDLTSFNTVNCTGFAEVFLGCTNLINLDLSGFDTSNSTKMVRMFSGCTKLSNLDVSNFYISKNTEFGGMFANCCLLEKIDLSNFDTTNVTADMNDTFYNCKNLKTLILGNKFVINEGVNIDNILYNVPSDIKITAIEDTRDKIINNSNLTINNFEIIS